MIPPVQLIIPDYPKTPPPHTYPGKLFYPEDGDTLTAFLDFGLRMAPFPAIRLYGVNCPELKIPDPTNSESPKVPNPLGLAAKQFTLDWLDEAEARVTSRVRWPLRVGVVQADKYGGRWDCWVWRICDQRCLNADLLSEKHAVIFL